MINYAKGGNPIASTYSIEKIAGFDSNGSGYHPAPIVIRQSAGNG